jgi:hypothetical protein
MESINRHYQHLATQEKKNGWLGFCKYCKKNVYQNEDYEEETWFGKVVGYHHRSCKEKADSKSKS